ncbi:MAG TPA: DapH/DapD/GlmU-related protein [Chloroflexota bacterium]
MSKRNKRLLLWLLISPARARARVTWRLFGSSAVEVLLTRLNKWETQAVLRDLGATLGHSCDVESGLIIHHSARDFANLRVGSLVHIGKDVFLDLAAPIVIGERATISMRAIILTHTDAGASPLAGRFLPGQYKSVEIGAGAYIGAGAIILPGAAIGERAIVGAGAVVTRDVPAETVVAGSPARVLRSLCPVNMAPLP